jgi:heterotetrameric sarcosine oxidase beta subunit
MQTFSALELFKQGLAAQSGWRPQWRRAEPKPAYDAVIVGGGGHGLGAAYYLAKQHGLRNIAVLEKGWLGGGNTGRNTTIIRSNYLFDESAALYDHAVKLWEGLSQELNYNVMFSQRGVMMMAHTVHDVQVFKRHIHANRGGGQGLLSAAEYRRQYALSGAGGLASAPRRHGAPRRGGLGLCPGGRCSGCRYRGKLRGDGDPPQRLRRG